MTAAIDKKYEEMILGQIPLGAPPPPCRAAPPSCASSVQQRSRRAPPLLAWLLVHRQTQ